MRSLLAEPIITPTLSDYLWWGVSELHSNESIAKALNDAVEWQNLDVVNLWLQAEPRLIFSLPHYDGYKFKNLLQDILAHTSVNPAGELIITVSGAGVVPKYTIEAIKIFFSLPAFWCTSAPIFSEFWGNANIISTVYESGGIDKLKAILLFVNVERLAKNLGQTDTLVKMTEAGHTELVIRFMEIIQSRAFDIPQHIFIQIIRGARRENNTAILEKALDLFPAILNECDLVDIISYSGGIRNTTVDESIMRRYPNKLKFSRLLRLAITSSPVSSIADAVLRLEPDVIVADMDNLHHAAYYGHLPTVQLFIARGVRLNNFNTIDGWWERPLMVALRRGKFEVARALIAAGAYLGGYAVRRQDCTTLDYTITKSSVASGIGCVYSHSSPIIVRRYGNDFSTAAGATSFCLALDSANDTVLDVFYARKDELIDGVKLIDYAGEYLTPLMHLVLSSLHSSVMERLIREGADLHTTVNGKDALFYAIDSGNADKVCTFFSLIVTHRSYEDINKMLIGGHDEVKPARDLIKTNPIYLDVAIRRGDPAIVELLLIHGADPTPVALASAVTGGNLAVIQKLVAAGADINQVNVVTNKSAMTLARELVKEDVVAFFTQYLEMKAAHTRDNPASLVRRIANPHRFLGGTHLAIDYSGEARGAVKHCKTHAIDASRVSPSIGL